MGIGSVGPVAPRPFGFAGENKRALAGFFVSGMIVSFLGAVLPAWGHHLDSNFLTVGYYFLFLNLGLFAGARIAYSLLPARASGSPSFWLPFSPAPHSCISASWDRPGRRRGGMPDCFSLAPPPLC